MCFTTRLGERFNVAKHDIKCYKVLYKLFNGEYITPYRWVSVQVGETLSGRANGHTLEKANFMIVKKNEILLNFYAEVGGEKPTDLLLDDEVVHAYATLETAEEHKKDFYGDSSMSIIVTEWTIPEGAFYMVNEEGEIVGSKMTFDKEIV